MLLRNVIAISVLLAITANGSAQSSNFPKIEPKLLEKDFQIARTALEEGHSGIYRYTPKVELDAAFDAAARKLDRPMDSLEFYRILAPAVARIKCGHTGVLPPQDLLRATDLSIPLFPFDVEVLDGKVYVAREYLPDEQKLAGLEILHINQMGIDPILSTMLAATPGDADSQTVRPWRIAHQEFFAFPRMLYSLLGIEAPFQIDFRDPTSSKRTTLKLNGVTGPDRGTIAKNRYPQDKKPNGNASLKFLEDGKIAVLTVREFSGMAESKPLGEYFDDTFRQIHEQGSESLIIDV